MWETWATTLEDDEPTETPKELQVQSSQAEVELSTTISNSLPEDFTPLQVNYSPVSFTLPLTKTTA